MDNRRGRTRGRGRGKASSNNKRKHETQDLITSAKKPKLSEESRKKIVQL